MGGAKSCMVVCFMLACSMLVAQQSEAFISCRMVAGDMMPCIGYARNGGSMPHACCNGVRRLLAVANSVADRQQACNCAKNFAAMVPGVLYDLINTIPNTCGVPLSFSISPDIDCSTVG